VKNLRPFYRPGGGEGLSKEKNKPERMGVEKKLRKARRSAKGKSISYRSAPVVGAGPERTKEEATTLCLNDVKHSKQDSPSLEEEL